ncbi:hypothetical protein WME90_20220 [Sorangium sp. So ce375]|uniref:hypothetical protein n=1 Tax=Sorangium sp. So ce375 TaxID=3133306 RepID=UPI003F5B0C2C
MKASHTILALACFFTAACSPQEDDLCDYKCDCEGCSDREYGDCLNRYDDRYADADRRDCVDRYDDLLACEDDTWSCDGDKWSTSCKYEREALDRCID